MLVEIKTRDINKLFDPFKDAIKINGTEFILDLKKLSKLVENPNNSLFSNTENPEQNFYNRLAFYIINYENNKHININLEKEEPYSIIENGLIHYIATQYLKEPNLFADIEENSTGLNFIKTKKLNPTEQKTTPYQEAINLSQINFEDQVVVDNFFTWVNGDSDNEKDKTFYLKTLEECVKFNQKREHKEHALSLKKLVEIYNQIPEKIIKDPSFQDEIFKRQYISEGFFEIFCNGNPIIDFASDKIKNKIISEVENGDYKWVKTIHSAMDSYNKTPQLNTITYMEELYNHPKTIESLLNGSVRGYGFSSSEFNLKNIYSKLRKENKEKKELVFKFIEICESEHSGSEKWIADYHIFEIPIAAFRDEEILKRVAYTMDWQKLKEEFSKQSEPIPKLKKEFILSVARDIRTHNFRKFITGFFRGESFDDDFKKSILNLNPSLREDKMFHHMYGQIDFLMFLVNDLRIKTDNISFSLIKPFLFKDDLKEEEKLFIEKYLIETKKNLEKPGVLNIPKELHEDFKERHQKLEFMFYKIDSWSSWRDDAIKRLKRIKDPQEMIDFFNNTKRHRYDLDAKSIFSGISSDLKSNSDVMFSFLKNIGTDIDLTECGNFIFNKQNCIKLLDFSVSLRKFIPEQMYYDKDFSLALAERLDKHANFDNVPVKVKKFFEQKEVNENYHTFLKSFIFYNEMVKKLDTSNDQPIVRKRIKI